MNAVLWFAALGAAAGFWGVRSSRPNATDAADAPTGHERVDLALRRFIAYGVVPFWMIPGIADYACHRATAIEHTSGTHESLTHALMISSTGAGVAAGLFLEVDEDVLAIMLAAALVHEAIVIWDVAYAQERRPPKPFEQHVHSFLEVLPFAAFAGMCCLHPAACRRLFSREFVRRGFRLEAKRRPLAPAYVASILLLGACALGIPYAEEFVRCYRVDGTILPRSG